MSAGDAAFFDYYLHEDVASLWDSDWKTMARNGSWFSRTQPGEVSIDEVEDQYFPYGCNICKLCPLTGTNLLKCSKCKVMLYCCAQHQRLDWNRNHKQWCKAFCACRDGVVKPTDLQSWRLSAYHTLALMEHKMDIPNHSNLRQYSTMQPRCRKCYAAASDGATLVTCPECCGVALCVKCHEEGNKDTAAFHLGSAHPENECEQHFLSLTCLGMIIEQGCSLIIPSNTDCQETFVPKDWHEYFARKRADFDVPLIIMRLPPVVAFIADGLSTPLTIQNSLNQVDRPIREKLVIHIVGASSPDTMGASKYIELVRLNPALTEFELVLIGPQMAPFDEPDASLERSGRPIRPSCNTSLTCRRGVYHEVAPNLEASPDVIFLPHAGIHDPIYTDSWRPTIEYIAREHPSVPVIVTGYTFAELTQDIMIVDRWGMTVVEAPRPNPFRGLRPYSDPMREGADFFYGNASYSIVQGSPSEA